MEQNQSFLRITSRENRMVKLIVSLQTSRKARRQNGLFVLEGLRLCSDAVDNGISFSYLLVSESAAVKYRGAVARFAQRAAVCCSAPDDLFRKLSDTASPQGILAVCRMDEVRQARIDPAGRYIALENIADPANLGAVARTAEALGASGVIVTASGCDPFEPKVLRASMGTLLRLPLIEVESIASLARTAGLSLYAFVPAGGAVSVCDVAFEDGCAVVIGNEANGLLPETIAVCGQSVTIPMKGNAESLNAAAAAAIAIWEMIK